jgi:hypothetical protein
VRTPRGGGVAKGTAFVLTFADQYVIGERCADSVKVDHPPLPPGSFDSMSVVMRYDRRRMTTVKRVYG